MRQVKISPALLSHLLDNVLSSVYAGHTTRKPERAAAHEALAQGSSYSTGPEGP